MHSLESDDFDEHIFYHRATGYGVELCEGTAQKRKAAFTEHFDEPIVMVDAKDVDDIEDIVEEALRELGATDEELENRLLGPIDLRRAINETETNFVIRNFDSMDSEVRTSAAQMMKGIAEGLDSEDIMLGYGAGEGGAVVRAEPDLRMRVHTWSVTAPEQEN